MEKAFNARFWAFFGLRGPDDCFTLAGLALRSDPLEIRGGMFVLFAYKKHIGGGQNLVELRQRKSKSWRSVTFFAPTAQALPKIPRRSLTTTSATIHASLLRPPLKRSIRTPSRTRTAHTEACCHHVQANAISSENSDAQTAAQYQTSWQRILQG